MAKIVRKDVQIAPDGGPVEAEVVSVFAHHVRYKADLFDAQGNSPQRIDGGSSLQTDPPPFAISVIPPQLVGRFLVVDADIFNLGTTNNFEVRVVFRQGGSEIDRLTISGTFVDNVSIAFIARFV